MAKLIITRGLPGCGKTTFAKAWVAENPRTRARVNRDDIGIQLHGRRFYEDPDLMQDTEKAITIVHHAQIAELLKRGWDVICDDTNLRRRFARDLRDLALRNNAQFEIKDMLGVPLDVVLDQNAGRGHTNAHVPEDIILTMHSRLAAKNAYKIPLEDDQDDIADAARPYVPAPGALAAIMVDIDGTVATMAGRSPYDETRVHEDAPNHAVIETVRAMSDRGYRVVFCSGRTRACYDATYAWLEDYVQVPIEGLFMRAEGDTRKDWIIKLELFDQHIRDRYDILGVLDDREQVVKAWRSIGLTVFAVAEGKF